MFSYFISFKIHFNPLISMLEKIKLIIILYTFHFFASIRKDIKLNKTSILFFLAKIYNSKKLGWWGWWWELYLNSLGCMFSSKYIHDYIWNLKRELRILMCAFFSYSFIYENEGKKIHHISQKIFYNESEWVSERATWVSYQKL